MLEQSPRLVVGIDPNIKAWLEFQVLQHYAQRPELQLEVLDGGELHYPNTFDVVFCLGVLYHTPDPVGMLRVLWKSMKPKAQLIIDCQGIPVQGAEDNPVALIPRRAYAKGNGMWFLPTPAALRIWLERSNFREIEFFYSEKLTTDEQRSTKWADIPSLAEALDPEDDTKTVEGYPAPWRYYVRCVRG